MEEIDIRALNPVHEEYLTEDRRLAEVITTYEKPYDNYKVVTTVYDLLRTPNDVSTYTVSRLHHSVEGMDPFTIAVEEQSERSLGWKILDLLSGRPSRDRDLIQISAARQHVRTLNMFERSMSEVDSVEVSLSIDSEDHSFGNKGGVSGTVQNVGEFREDTYGQEF